jgi:hypothetical protein
MLKTSIEIRLETGIGYNTPQCTFALLNGIVTALWSYAESTT